MGFGDEVESEFGTSIEFSRTDTRAAMATFHENQRIACDGATELVHNRCRESRESKGSGRGPRASYCTACRTYSRAARFQEKFC